MKLIKIYLSLNVFFILLSCGGGGGSSETENSLTTNVNTPTQTTSPSTNTWPGATWESENPQEVGMDEAKLQQALDYAFVESRNTQSVVIVSSHSSHSSYTLAPKHTPAQS